MTVFLNTPFAGLCSGFWVFIMNDYVVRFNFLDACTGLLFPHVDRALFRFLYQPGTEDGIPALTNPQDYLNGSHSF